MPAPSSSLATLRPDLAGSVEEFDLAADRQGFIGHRVLPVFDVGVASGNYGRIPVEQLLENRDTARSPGGGYSRGKWTFLPQTFATAEHGAEEPVDDAESKMYADYFTAEQVSAQRAKDAVLRNAEKRKAALIFNATTWTGSPLTTAVGTEWSTVATATPIVNVNAARLKVWDGCGLWPNSLIINRHVFLNLRECAEVLDRIAASGAGSGIKAADVTVAMLSLVFDLNVIVAGAAKNTANKPQTAVFGEVWSSEYAMVARICETNDIREPGLGRTFHWAGDGSSVDGTMESYRDETVRGDIVRCRHQVEEKVIYTECGHLLSNITA